MNKQEYMRQLSVALSHIPAEERDSAIAYYNEYFDEAGVEQEAQTIESLGSPQKVASQIKAQCAMKNLEQQSAPTVKKGISTIWLVVLGIFAAPIALPVAIAVAALVFALVVTVACVLLTIVIASIAIFVAGIVTVVSGFGLFLLSPIAAATTIGMGFVMLGSTLLLAVLAVLGTGAFLRCLARLLNKSLNKKGGRENE